MIITKYFEIGITGKFQGRKFGTTLTFDTTNPVDATALKEISPLSIYAFSSKMQETVEKMVGNDIKALAASDPNFVIIQAAAQEELDKFVIYQENAKKAESKRGKI